MKLFRCDATGPTLVATDTTDSTGTFDFGALTGPDWYYVDVVESGPLGGMVPANGTNNPSAPVEVGAGDAAMLFEFED